MIIIFPWARKTTDGKLSPKDYPHWRSVTKMLSLAKFKTIQVSCKGESDIACDERKDDLPLSSIKELLSQCQTWISVDSFVPHMAWTVHQPGVAIFGSSDPEIYGHPENINLLKARRYLRVRQFGLWSQEAVNPEAFVDPAVVVAAAAISAGRRNKEVDAGR